MKKSLFAKIFISYLILIVTLSSVILFVSFRAIKQSYLDTASRDLTRLCIALEPKIITFLAEQRVSELDAFVKDLGKHIQTRITVIDMEGTVLADSEKNPRDMEKHNLRAEILQARQGAVGTSVRFSTTVKEEMLYVALPIEHNGARLGVLRASLFLKDIKTLLHTLQVSIIASALGIGIVALLGAVLFAYHLTKPVRQLMAAAHRVAAGDFNAKALLDATDEFGELGRSFNYMTEELSRFFAELSWRKDELNSIIASIQDGLLVLDKKGVVVLSNESIRAIVANPHCEGKYYWEVIREPQFNTLVNSVSTEKKSAATEIAINGRTFLCSAAALGAQEKIVVMFHDITEVKRVEKIKKDFVVNVSHELRTPLTSIKGFVETLEEESGGKNREYVKIIKRNTERLTNIVEDLLLLSELEEKGTTLHREACDFKTMLENVQRIFEHRLAAKGLVMKIEIPADLPVIMADSFKLEQVFINLIDNAIKYTEHGGITITLACINSVMHITVRDTGIGIPSEHLPRIFERFYVVDASRSRQLGGTGLGLSIVKHIVLLHQGTIDVHSSSEAGTTFHITLPINLPQ
jgi:two-component system phosphate regulon sensor histidine kinase PhoR